MAEGDEFTGRTVEHALAEAEASLGIDRQNLDLEVISQGSRGVFGIGAETARIRVRPRERATTGSRSTETSSERERSSGGARQASAVAESRPPEAPDTSAPDPELAAEATRVLHELLGTMGFNADVRVQKDANPLTLTITGQNLGVLIGRRGDNLASLQFMLNLILSKNRRQWPRVVLDIENYRARREESLTSLADRIGERVRRSQRPFTLEAMPASDRRIIHLTLRDVRDIETYSIGEGPARRVVVAPLRPMRGGMDRDHA